MTTFFISLAVGLFALCIVVLFVLVVYLIIEQIKWQAKDRKYYDDIRNKYAELKQVHKSKEGN